MLVKNVQKYIYLYTVKKMNLFGLFLDIEEERDKDNETGLKEGGGIKNRNYSASIHSNDNYNLVQ